MDNCTKPKSTREGFPRIKLYKEAQTAMSTLYKCDTLFARTTDESVFEKSGAMRYSDPAFKFGQSSSESSSSSEDAGPNVMEYVSLLDDDTNTSYRSRACPRLPDYPDINVVVDFGKHLISGRATPRKTREQMLEAQNNSSYQFDQIRKNLIYRLYKVGLTDEKPSTFFSSSSSSIDSNYTETKISKVFYEDEDPRYQNCSSIDFVYYETGRVAHGSGNTAAAAAVKSGQSGGDARLERMNTQIFKEIPSMHRHQVQDRLAQGDTINSFLKSTSLRLGSSKSKFGNFWNTGLKRINPFQRPGSQLHNTFVYYPDVQQPSPNLPSSTSSAQNVTSSGFMNRWTRLRTFVSKHYNRIFKQDRPVAATATL